MLLSIVGIVGTLTRQVWLASGLTTIATMFAFAPLRRFALPTVAVAAIVAVGSLVLIPSLGTKASARADAERPVWGPVQQQPRRNDHGGAKASPRHRLGPVHRGQP